MKPSHGIKGWHPVCIFCGVNSTSNDCRQRDWAHFLIHMLVCHSEKLTLLGMAELPLKHLLLNLAQANKKTKMNEGELLKLRQELIADSKTPINYYEIFKLAQEGKSNLILHFQD